MTVGRDSRIIEGVWEVLPGRDLVSSGWRAPRCHSFFEARARYLEQIDRPEADNKKP